MEPELQPLTGEEMQHKTANSEEGACLDIRVSGFWGSLHERAFIDMRVFNPYALLFEMAGTAVVLQLILLFFCYGKSDRESESLTEARSRNLYFK